MTPPIRPELIDEPIDTYVDLREECLALTGAHQRWSRGTDADRSLAFATYRAALDREQQASLVYADRSGRVQRQLASKLGPLRRLWRSGGGKAATRPIETRT